MDELGFSYIIHRSNTAEHWAELVGGSLSQVCPRRGDDSKFNHNALFIYLRMLAFVLYKRMFAGFFHLYENQTIQIAFKMNR
jgi:hypothetical protein